MVEVINPEPDEVLKSLRSKAPLTARMVIREMIRRGVSYSKIAELSGVAESNLRRHVVNELPMKPRTARQLQDWGQGVISATLMFEQGDVE
jgi:hypothetical protein